MLNPYDKTTEAALFVDYYGSRRMLQDSTNRLYREGVRRRKEAIRSVEEEVYQPPPTVRRTPAEIDHYLRTRVEEELLRRQQHRAELAREIYGETESPPRYLTGEQFQRHVKRVYTDPLRRRALREREVERVFGAPSKSPSPQRKGKKNTNKDAESPPPWRPSSAKLRYNDGQQCLVSQYEYYADPKKYSEVLIKNKPGANRTPNYNRLAELSRPLSVNPPVVAEIEESEKPPFRVDRRVNYE